MSKADVRQDDLQSRSIETDAGARHSETRGSE